MGCRRADEGIFLHMPLSHEAFKQRVARLKADIVEQGRRVTRIVESSIESVFDADHDKAHWVIENDSLIDRVDVEIERAAVALLSDSTREGADLSGDQLRMVLTVVKVNNELERIADGAVDICERVEEMSDVSGAFPPTFRVMANSVVGILDCTIRSLDTLDTKLAETVLSSDDTVDEFERVLLRETQQRLANGDIDVDLGFALHTIAGSLERMGDHCTNIAEQVIYVVTGKIVRHTEGHWTSPETPA
jgi:phosphate transport system protein